MANLIQIIKDDIPTTNLKTITITPYINLDTKEKQSVPQETKQAESEITSFSAQCDIASMLFYFKFQLTTTSDTVIKHTFNGNAGGIAIPGGGVYFGDIYLNSSVDDLFSQTVSFAFTATPVYLAVMFFDNNSTLLGHFQSGGVTGTGGGSGSWETN